MSVKFNGMHQSQIKLQDFSAYFWNTPRMFYVEIFEKMSSGGLEVSFSLYIYDCSA